MKIYIFWGQNLVMERNVLELQIFFSLRFRKSCNELVGFIVGEKIYYSHDVLTTM